MGNLTFDQVFRYALPGGVFLLVLLGGHTSDPYGPPLGFALGDAALLGFLTLLLGGLIYAVHRAILYPVIYNVLLCLMRLSTGSCMESSKLSEGICGFCQTLARLLGCRYSEPFERDRVRWELRTIADLADSAEPFKILNVRRIEAAKVLEKLADWGTQIHYLYCALWAIGLGALAGCLLKWKFRNEAFPEVFWWGTLILSLAAIGHHVRYLYYEASLLREYGETPQPPPAPAE